MKAIIGGFASWRHATDGAIAVEMALVAPVLAVILVLLIDIGMGTYEQMQVQEAAQAGIQYAADHGWDSDGVQNAALNATSLPVTLSPAPSQSCGCATSTGIASATCGAACPDGSTAGGSYVFVTAQAQYHTLINYPGISNPMTLSASAVLRLQ
jgi:Flp pilus assembly protein TadG